LGNPPTVAIVAIEFLIPDRSTDGCPVAAGKIIVGLTVVVTQESDDITFAIIGETETDINTNTTT
jgi:hypothetical protein